MIAARTEAGGKARKCIGEWGERKKRLSGGEQKRRLTASRQGGGVEGVSLQVVSDQ